MSLLHTDIYFITFLRRLNDVVPAIRLLSSAYVSMYATKKRPRYNKGGSRSNSVLVVACPAVREKDKTKKLWLISRDNVRRYVQWWKRAMIPWKEERCIVRNRVFFGERTIGRLIPVNSMKSEDNEFR